MCFFKHRGDITLCVSLCLEMVPSMAEVPRSHVNRAVDLERKDLLWLMCAVSNFPFEAIMCPCSDGDKAAAVSEQQSRKQGSLPFSPAR